MASNTAAQQFEDVDNRAMMKNIIQRLTNREELKKLFDQPDMRYRVDLSHEKEGCCPGTTLFLSIISLEGTKIRGLFADKDDNIFSHCTFDLSEFE